MDDTALINEIQSFLTTYHAAKTRYRHLVFSSKDMAIVEKLPTMISQLLPAYQIWDAEQPQLNHPPPINCGRKHFIDATFKHTLSGLIICEPFNWLNHWSDEDKKIFWTLLGGKESAHNVVVISHESYEFKRLTHQLSAHPLNSMPVTVWTSSKKQIL